MLAYDYIIFRCGSSFKILSCNVTFLYSATQPLLVSSCNTPPSEEEHCVTALLLLLEFLMKTLNKCQ